MQSLSELVIDEFRHYYDALVGLLPSIVIAIIVFFIFYTLSRLVRKSALKRLTEQMDDDLLARFISRLIGVVILLAGIMLVMKILGLGGLAIGVLSTAGVGAFIIGFAFKDIGENFLAGIVMAFNRPFRLGDTVELNGQKGQVINLTLRDTQIKSFDGKDIYIPNAMVVKNPVINYTIDGFLRLEFKVGIDYGTDVGKAMEIILKCADEIPGILKEPKKPFIAVSDLAASALVLTVYFWINTFDKTKSGVDLKNSYVDLVLERLGKEGIYTPGDILELKTYKGESLAIEQTGGELRNA